ncbi:hypothetical protein [Dyella japonica]|uniref:hypothetical protein n=1 Tax=Dyella japonica TaxID=231455 RepID=UPI00036CB9EA|nr:hypothetical protein [Dyella japonica]
MDPSDPLTGARQEAFRSTEWLPAKSLDHQHLKQWLREERIFGVRLDGVDWYPAYLFEPTSGRPAQGLDQVIRAFGGVGDGWRLAFWFASVNSYLGGKRPQDELPRDPAAVASAAIQENQPVEHG